MRIENIEGDVNHILHFPMSIMVYNILLLGDAGVGKSTFLAKHQTGKFDPKYVATVGKDLYTFSFETTSDPVKFNVWDTSGQGQIALLTFPTRIDGVIVMFDVTSKASIKNCDYWTEMAKSFTTGPIILVGNKVDIAIGQKKMPSFAEQIFKISVRRNYNLDMPFLWLARKLKNDSNLEITVNKTIQSSAIQMEFSEEIKVQLEADQEAALHEHEHDSEGEEDLDEQLAKTHQDLQQAIIAYAQLRQYGSGSVCPEIIRMVLDTLQE